MHSGKLQMPRLCLVVELAGGVSATNKLPVCTSVMHNFICLIICISRYFFRKRKVRPFKGNHFTQTKCLLTFLRRGLGWECHKNIQNFEGFNQIAPKSFKVPVFSSFAFNSTIFFCRLLKILRRHASPHLQLLDALKLVTVKKTILSKAEVSLCSDTRV